MEPLHSIPPSPWVERFAALAPARSSVLDLACGSGRHARLFAAAGHSVEAVDKDPEVLAALADVAGITTRQSDLEDGPWPYYGRVFDVVVVTNYLYRPLLPQLLNVVQPQGVLIYETFMVGNERFGKPSNPTYLLRTGELLDVVRGRMAVVAFEQGETRSPKQAMVQRLCAVRDSGSRLVLP